MYLPDVSIAADLHCRDGTVKYHSPVQTGRSDFCNLDERKTEEALIRRPGTTTLRGHGMTLQLAPF
jgi:hypothetical protein